MSPRIVLFCSCLVFAALGCATSRPAATGVVARPPSATDPLTDRIRFHEAQVEKDPTHSVAWSLVAHAYLARARQTQAPEDLAKARTAAKRSLDLQPSYEALRVMGQVSAFGHRFEEALQWAKKAEAASPHDGVDSRVLNLKVEAMLGLGRAEDALALLPQDADGASDFHMAASVARVLVTLERPDEARRAFLKAAEYARAENADALAAWAEISAAGTLIDNGRADEAEPFLARAEALDPRNVELAIHRAEVLESRGDVAGSLRIYEQLLAERPDAALSHIAWRLARSLGDDERALRHFHAAETGFQKVVEAGEVYSIEGLARLYAEAGVRLAEARALALRNLEFKKDADAREVLMMIDARQSGGASR